MQPGAHSFIRDASRSNTAMQARSNSHFGTRRCSRDVWSPGFSRSCVGKSAHGVACLTRHRLKAGLHTFQSENCLRARTCPRDRRWAVFNPRGTEAAFTIVELMVSVSIMSLIVFGLYQMFNQTQRALRNNITQVDVLESGRAALNMMARELEQISPSQIGGGTNLFVGMSPYPPVPQLDLDEKTPLRTNLLQEFFFVSPNTNTWTGTGYRVIGATHGVGALYRFSVSTNFRFLNAANLSLAYLNAPVTNPVTRSVSTNFHRVADGIIHLRLTAFDAEGRRMGLDTTNVHPAYRVLRQSIAQRQVPATNNVIIRQDLAGQSRLIFLSNAVPAYLELEFGVLEPQTFVKFESLREGPASAAQDFLKKQAAKVHLFRQRIPIRTASQ